MATSEFQGSLRAFWEHLGLLGACPMAGLATGTLVVGAILSAIPVIGLFGYPLLAMGGMFTGALSFGGTVTQPLGQALGGVLCGLGAAGALFSALGLFFVAFVAELGAPAILGAALCVGLAAVGAAGWASLRWRAGPMGVGGAALWPIGTALMAGAGFVCTRLIVLPHVG